LCLEKKPAKEDSEKEFGGAHEKGPGGLERYPNRTDKNQTLLITTYIEYKKRSVGKKKSKKNHSATRERNCSSE